MRIKINYIISFVIIQVTLAYLIIVHVPGWVGYYIESVPGKWTLLILVFFVVTNSFWVGYIYLFPPAAIQRTNISWLISAWGAVAGIPATTGLYLITEIDVFGDELIKIDFVELGAASLVVSAVSLGAMFLFNREYNRLLEPGNVGWSTTKPTLR